MRAGSAVSRHPEVRKAARAAAEQALSQAGLTRASCLLVAGTVDHFDQSIELCSELREVAGHAVQIVGGAVQAVEVRGDLGEDGPALGVLALDAPAHAFAWRPDDGAQLKAAAQAGGRGALLCVFADPAAPLERLTTALARDAAGLLVAGGGASAEGGLILDDDLSEASAVGLVLPGPARVLVAQSGQPVSEPQVVTAADGRLIKELDGQSALQALLALRGTPGLRDLDAALPFLGVAITPQPGEKFDGDDCLQLALVGVDEETGALATSGRVAEGQLACFTLRDGMGARRSLERALGRAPRGPAAFGAYFDCASRGTQLYGVDGLDLQLIEKSLGSFPLLSMRTSFELGPSGAGVGLHLFTGVLALGG